MAARASSRCTVSSLGGGGGLFSAVAVAGAGARASRTSTGPSLPCVSLSACHVDGCSQPPGTDAGRRSIPGSNTKGEVNFWDDPIYNRYGSAIKSFLLCKRPAVSIIKISLAESWAFFAPSNATDAGSPLSFPETTITPIRLPQVFN